MGPRLRRSTAVLGALVIVAAGASRAAVARGYVFRATVTPTQIGRPRPTDFLGLALEYNEITQLAGTTPQSANPLFVALLHNLDPTGRPSLRIGGQSTDRSWWPVPGMARPLGITYNLTPAWTAAALSLAQATNAQLLLGVNLEANRARIEQVEASELVNGIGAAHIAALEVGNEPDLYPLIPWYKELAGKPLPWYSRQGTPVYSRRPQYGPQQFSKEFSQAVKLLPPLPIAGPETGNWLLAFSRFLSPRSQVRMLTSHAYGLNQCVTDPHSPQFPSVPNLLSLTASRSLIAGLQRYVALAHRDGATYRVDEMGSISCNGRPGVSNTQASALWIMDALFSIDAAGVDGVNLHTYTNAVNDLFEFHLVDGQWQGTVNPLYYGALMFAQAAPAGSTLLTLNSGSQSRMRAWATLAPDHHVRVLLINDSLNSGALAQVRLPTAASGPASVERLLASGAYATTGVTLGGQSFPVPTTTAALAAPVTQSVTPRAGTYSVTLPAATAALLTFSAAG